MTTITQSAKRMAVSADATDISSKVSPAARAFLRKPRRVMEQDFAVFDLPRRGDGVRVRPASAR